MTYIVLGSEEEGLYWEVGCYSEGCYSEVLLYREGQEKGRGALSRRKWSVPYL